MNPTRLAFKLPEWCRIIWNDATAQNVWQYRISRIANVFLYLERQMVTAGLKPGCLTSVSAEDALDLIMSLKGTEYQVLVLNKTANNGNYTNETKAAVAGQPALYRIFIGHKSLEKEWLKAYQTNDNVKIGQMLGFPSCCQEFFQKYWVEEQYNDLSYPMSLTGVDGPKECNILLRWLGVRAVSHLPCKFDCQASYEIGRKFIEFGYSQNFTEEMQWLEEMLDWPVQWSALHGIAEIRTPILKISVNTVAFGEKLTIDKPGFSYPAEGASGNRFPYINKATSTITNSNSFKRSLLLDNQWKDNGFSTFEAMKHSHTTLLELFNETKNQLSIIDFGCGNGELLKNLKTKMPNIDVSGIEIDTFRYNRIAVNHSTGNWFNADMFDMTKSWVSARFDIAIVMPGRLFEVDTNQANLFVNWLFTHCDRIVFYAYGDCLTKLDKLPSLLKQFNLQFNIESKSKSDHCAGYLGKIVPLTLATLNIL